MKALSIWQPHASLLMSGVFKPYETRSWKPWASLIGQRVAIHAGKATADLNGLAAYVDHQAVGGAPDQERDAFRAALKQLGFSRLNALPRGCLLGTAVLAGFLPTEALDKPGCFGNFGPGWFAWQFIDHERLDEPIPFVGQQGFFEVPDHMLNGKAPQ